MWALCVRLVGAQSHLRAAGTSVSKAKHRTGQSSTIPHDLLTTLNHHPTTTFLLTPVNVGTQQRLGTPNIRPQQRPTRVPNTLPYLASFVILAIASWAAFTVYATNKEKLGSSIFKSVVSQIKSSPRNLHSSRRESGGVEKGNMASRSTPHQGRGEYDARQGRFKF